MFKKKKKGNVRQKAAVVEEDINNEPSISEVLEQTREEQSFRKRNQGISSVGLATGQKITAEAEAEMGANGWTLSTGGIMPKAKDRDRDREEEAAVTDLSKAFTGTQDIDWEDAQMKKYVEEQIRLGQGVQEKVDDRTEYEKRRMDLYKVPEELRELQRQADTSRRKTLPNQGILSNAILSGIPEVDLGMENKIKNIEETEAARLAAIEKSLGNKRKSEEGKPPKKPQPDSYHNFGRARFMRGNPSQKHASTTGAVYQEGSELTDHKKVFESALKKGFESGVTDSVKYTDSELTDSRTKEKRAGTEYATDDQAFNQFKKRNRKF
eukprot:m.18963 g.18963  ORF g.18963 m.18963 type:complete len:324 (-) comp6459_c0_seq1:192-1163(-)